MTFEPEKMETMNRFSDVVFAHRSFVESINRATLIHICAQKHVAVVSIFNSKQISIEIERIHSTELYYRYSLVKE